ncbi:cytidylate kinase-like family protein [Flammeovirga pectinis]|uniref:Cytidylate kinase-like family protein n=1 Tax=Flammeovirga pectinis TaxID=2494373 RepID=A0A3S9P4Z4_9BACT|nr:cytidylate kinase-like family protein [Flammeovirga pectinis]AZQ63233.1 cytidylate kinase-like family protein [Flammeovirga pectinis]
METNVYTQLIKNLEYEFTHSVSKKAQSEGTIITLSRDYGSGIKKVGEQLVKYLNKNEVGFNLLKKEWRLIDTTVIRDLSKELSLEYKLIEEYVPFEKKGIIEQLIHSFGPSYNKLDGKLSSTLKTIVHAYFERGNVVILGRGAGFFAEELDNALKIKVNSTMQFRIGHLMKAHNLNFDDAKMKMLENSKLRNDFLEHIQKGQTEHYDTVIDRSRLDDATLTDYLYSFTIAKVKELSRRQKNKNKFSTVY